MYQQRGKRVFDLLLVIVTAPIWLPLLAVAALLVRVKLGAPIFFHQQRPGKGGRIFAIIKLRTMTDARDAQGNLLPDPERQTSFGRWMRRVSLDELPELINVLRGEMSLVGPRPLLIRYLPRYSPTQARRHEVLPGITGLAQVRGRNNITWDDKFNLDVWYVDHLSWWLDMQILCETVGKVLLREGVVEPSTGVHQEFMGSSTGSNQTPGLAHPHEDSEKR